MPLPTSGPISISMIRDEQVAGGFLSTYDLRQLSANAGFGTPDSMSEFYGYSACPPSGTYAYQYCFGCDLIYGYHNGSCGYYESNLGYSSSCCGGYVCNCGAGCAFYSFDCGTFGCAYCAIP